MTPEQKAANLELVAEAEAQLAAFKAELVVGLAADRPASDDRRAGSRGRRRGSGPASCWTTSVSEFFPDELALILNCSRAEATQLWERCSTLRLRLPSHLGGAGGRGAGLAEGAGDRRGARLART